MTTARLLMASYGYSEHRAVARPTRTLWKVGSWWQHGFIDGTHSGVWNQILEHLQAIADRQGMLDWEIHYVDGTVVRAHDSQSRWKKKGSEDEALGRTREWIQLH